MSAAEPIEAASTDRSAETAAVQGGGSSRLSQREYQTLLAHLKLNFRVAVATNIVMVLLLIGAAATASVFALAAETVPASIFGVLAVVTLSYGAIERPWRALSLANDRLALSQSVWIAYVESKEAIESGFPPDMRPAILGRAQNLWVDRMAVITQEDFSKVLGDLRGTHATAGSTTAATTGTEGEQPDTAGSTLDLSEAGGIALGDLEAALSGVGEATLGGERPGTDWLSAAELASAQLHTPPLNGMRVLWVDDHPEGNAGLQARLERSGASVITAGSNEAAQALFSAGAFDVVISDVSRDSGPDAGRANAGFEGVTALRETQGDLPAIFYCSRIDRSRTRRAQKLDAPITDSARTLIAELERLPVTSSPN